ncbi:MAG: hypothetical protein M1816_007598 [Peltula sp. TS41687]|nr:MAG: hypothetical protein M1816_007598 [Peltula sp. TS41687]
MGGQQVEEGSSPQPQHQQPQHSSHETLLKSSKRRNTVHSTSAAPTLTGPWSSTPVNHTSPQPILVPLYSPLWQLTQLNHFNQHAVLQGSLPYMSAYVPGHHDRTKPGSRASSPQRRGRPRARSPELSHAHDHGVDEVRSQRDIEGANPERNTAMAHKMEEPFPPFSAEPAASRHHSSLSHHSNSVPSTPRQRPRRLSLNSTPTSPREDAGRHSPRSVHSESNGHLPPLRRPLSGCRFETAMAFPRRRMPYALGGDRLEMVKAGVKMSLNADEEKKLSGDMRELYDRLLPSAESEERRAKFICKLERLLNEQWPGNDIKVRVFGSSGNLLCTSDSDGLSSSHLHGMVALELTDYSGYLYRDSDEGARTSVHIGRDGMERVVCVSNAKVPIVKMWDPELQLACDMNVNNTLALENTRMIKTYVEIDPRVRPLAMVIKHWTKRRVLNEAAFGGTLSSYTWICMILNFLQTRQPPILPCLHQRPHQKLPAVNGVQSAFADDLDSLQGYGNANKQTIGELLFQFFRYYAYEVDYEKDVISVRQGKLITQLGKGWHLMQNNRICVEEPFNTGRNLGNTADDASFRGLHLELRRAFRMIADDVDLAACCEQYVFPTEEERVWERPLPQPRPVLSRSSSQSGRGRRGGGPSRGGRQSSNQSRGVPHSARRASSSASLGNPNGAGSKNSSAGLSIQDYYRQAQAQLQLRDQLYESYQALQAQEQELRLIQAHNRAVSQAQAQARNESASRRTTHGHPPRLNGITTATAANIEPAPHTAPLRPDMYFYPLQYIPTQQYYAVGTSTNPSSPSISPAVPDMRHTSQRTNVTEGANSAPHRSHSQPARPVPSPRRANAVPASTVRLDEPLKLPPSDARQEFPSGEPSYLQLDSRQVASVAGMSRSDSMPKEYVGYYVEGAPLSNQRHYDDLVFRTVPLFGDFNQVSRSMQVEQSAADGLYHIRPSPRSPLPWDRTETLTNGQGSGPTMSTKSQSTRPPVSDPVREPRGPLIVDGSTSIPYADARSQQMTFSESTSASDDQGYDTPETTSDSHSQDQLDVLAAAALPQPLYPTLAYPDPNLYAEYGRPQVVSSTPPIAHQPIVQVVVPPSEPSMTSVASQSPATPVVGGLSIKKAPRSVSPPRSPHLPNGTFKSHAHKPLDKVPIGNGTKGPLELPQPPHLQAVPPLLSPVIEMKTPSPVMGKRFDYFSDFSHAKTNGTGNIKDVKKAGKGKELQSSPSPTSAAATISREQEERQQSAEVLGPTPNGHIREQSNTTVNGWQQTTPKHKKGTKSGSKKGTGTGTGSGKAQMESTLPINGLERKGG